MLLSGMPNLSGKREKRNRLEAVTEEIKGIEDENAMERGQSGLGWQAKERAKER